MRRYPIATRAFIVTVLFIASVSNLRSAEGPVAPNGTETGEELDSSGEKKATAAGEEREKKKKEKNVNIDAKMLYGQYNLINWTGSIIQSLDKFTYQLNSDFDRSGDFGYKNTGFYENEIGFTGKADLKDTWKLIPEAEVRNQSHGMFRNHIYREENRDLVKVWIKNVYEPLPTRWDFNIGGTYFGHRFKPSSFSDVYLRTNYRSSSFYKADGVFKWEYVWSTANKLKLNSKYSQYIYSENSEHDIHFANEFLWEGKVAEYLQIEAGPVYCYNQDAGHFPSGKVELSTRNLDYATVNASYTYRLVPFVPEDLYFKHTYMLPGYRFPPGRGHRAHLGLSVDAKKKSTRKFYVKRFKLKASGTYERNDRHYNFFSLSENILYPLMMNLALVSAKGEMAMTFAFSSGSMELGGIYEFSYPYASNRATYMPRHTVEGYIRLNILRIGLEFKNKYRDIIYVNPYYNTQLSPALTGLVILQVKVIDSFNLYASVSNIYNTRYSTVFGYPERGRTFSGGIRIII